MENKTFFEFIDQHLQQNEKVALVTITQTAGSSPSSVGQMMAVLADGTIAGTVGGGKTEFTLIQDSIQAIQSSTEPTIIPFSYNHATIGMACGGEMTGFIHILGNENHLYIFGGGHVSQSLAVLAKQTGFAVTVIEDRPEFRDSFPENVNYIVSTPEEYPEKVTFLGRPYVVICTRGHSADSDALHFVVDKPTKYIGMIGSTGKVKTVLGNLEEIGCTEEQFSRVYAPVGLNVACEIPAEIAVSIMAEMLIIKNNGTPAHKTITAAANK